MALFLDRVDESGEQLEEANKSLAFFETLSHPNKEKVMASYLSHENCDTMAQSTVVSNLAKFRMRVASSLGPRSPVDLILVGCKTLVRSTHSGAL